MKKQHRILSVLISVIMLFSVAAGCSGKDSGKNVQVKSESTQAKTESTQASADAKTTDQKSGPSWSWDTKPVKITWFCAEDWYKKDWNPDACLFDKLVTEQTGVSLEISTGNVDKLNALIASNSLPDVVTMYYGYPQRTLLENTGKVLPLNNLIKEYAPTFKYPQSMEKWFTNKDGNWYAFNNFFWAPEEMSKDNYFVTHNTYQARGDLMDKLGIKSEDFNTKQGTIDALKKVRDSKLEYKGLKVVPFYMGHQDMDGGVANMAAYLGMATENKDGNYVDYRKDPKGLEAIKFFNTLYREKLMPEENLTISRNQVGEYILKGAAFSFQGWATVCGKMTEFTDQDKGGYYVPVGPILGDEGTKPYLTTSSLIGWTSTLITKGAKNPDRIIRFFEYMYDEKTQLNCFFGPEGKVWERKADGKLEHLPDYLKAAKENPEKAKNYYGVDTFFPFVNWVVIQRNKFNPDPGYEPSESAKRNDAIEKHFAQYAFDDKCFSDVSPEGGSDEAGIAAKITEYWTKQLAKMIMSKSEADLDALYSETTKHMDELGYQKLYDVMNNKFKASKERLGIKYAWPAYQN